MSYSRDSLHSKSAQDFERLFPNKQAHIPDGNEDEPSSDADDDFDVDDPGFEEPVARGRTDRVAAENKRAADAAHALGVPAQRPSRAAAAAANQAMDAMHERGELV